MSPRLPRLLLLSALPALSLACSITDDSGNGAAKPMSPISTGIAILMKDSYYTPGSDSVNAGQHVVWVNQGKLPHGVMLVTPQGNKVVMEPGLGSFDTVFTQPGVYRFYCPKMTGMAGSVTVQ